MTWKQTPRWQVERYSDGVRVSASNSAARKLHKQRRWPERFWVAKEHICPLGAANTPNPLAPSLSNKRVSR